MPRKLAGPDRRDGGGEKKKNAGGKPSIEGSSSSSKAKTHSRHAQENARSPSKRKGLTMLCRPNGKNAQLLCQEKNKKEGGDGREADAQPFVEMAPAQESLHRPEWSSCRTKGW